LVAVALGALAVACSSCAAPISNDAKLHLAAALEDFKALGIGNEIEVREDGRRNIDLTPPSKPTRHIVRTFDDLGAFSRDHADVQIGPHSFKGDLETYAIHVDVGETGGLAGDLTLRRRVACAQCHR
jgi:hypothetical protein